MAKAEDKFIKAEITRFESMPTPIKAFFVIATTVGLGLFIYYMLGWHIGGYVFPSGGYYYLLYAMFGSCVFIALPARKKDKGRVPWYDIIFSVFAFGIPFYCFFHAREIVESTWAPPPSTFLFVLGTIYCLLALEGGRRIGGRAFLALCSITFLYPLFAGYMPGILWGINLSFARIVGNFAFTTNGVLGLPGEVMGEILIGFLLFAGMLMASGAGRFFLNLSLVLLGRYRGGPAKVAVLASGFFGSLSGSAIANTVATGAVTIPTMKRIGYPPHYAGAIEACASTGGTIMPPVMGAIAFIMSVITGIEYSQVLIAAFIPALLYYFGLMVQVDAYAAKVGLKGLERKELPSLKKTLKEGWIYLTVLIFLVFLLLYLRLGAVSPIYASGLMFVLSFTRKDTMMTPRRIVETITMIGSIITQTMSMIIPLGFILGGMTITGVSGSITTSLVALGGENLVLVLLIGVVGCYILGCMGLGAVAYIFLAVTMAPALVKIGSLNLLATHLFLICISILGGITPPIGVVGFVAAALAGARPMKTLVTSMRLGIVLIFVPFFFLFRPALVLQGSYLDTIYLFVLCLLGITLVAGGLEGYLLKIGKLELWQRPILVIAGLMLALPEWITTVVGAALAVMIISMIILIRRIAAVKPTTVT